MRKLVYLIASTLDGFIAEESRDNPSGIVFEDGDHVTALIAEYPEMVPGMARDQLGVTDVPHRHFDTVVEGRVSYQMGVDLGVADAYPHLEHYVFSRTLTAPADPAVKVIADDPALVVRELKSRQGQDIWLCGGGALAASLRDEIDEIHLKLNPVVLGRGAPLFDGPDGAGLDRYQLQSVRTFGSGVVLLIYTRRH